MQLSDYNFELPQELIAQIPSNQRGDSRLMVVERSTEKIFIDQFRNLIQYLTHNPLMIFNKTRVFPAKLSGFQKGKEKPTQILLIREFNTGVWEALIKGLGKIKNNTIFSFKDSSLKAKLLDRKNDRGILEFDPPSDIMTTLGKIAETPLPPYIRRTLGTKLEVLDRERYQTVYADKPGAIAAPTAGMHFTTSHLNKLQNSGINMSFLTLDIGPGTFQPIRTNNILEHKMEPEHFVVSSKVWTEIFQTKNAGRKILAVGTTTTRALESIERNFLPGEDIDAWTDKFIFPGYRFKQIDHLLTNFHLPKSTLFLLVCAFGGNKLMQSAYKKAVAEKFKFFSYGDSMLIL